VLLSDRKSGDTMSSVQIEKLKHTFQTIHKELGKAVIGQEQVVEHVLCAMLCGSNALLESVPGLGKTLLIKSISEVLDLDFRRIQCTPDLMPSDIIGTEIIDESSGKRVFKFQKGPVFTNILLADEINRATPKTQAALLEAMQEKQVTAAGKTHQLDKPFFVLATQNPIEQEGSLTLDQPVFVNGTLKTGHELLQYAEKSALIAEQKNNGTKLYHIPNAWTSTLDTSGKLIKTSCMLYTLPIDDEVISVRLKTGRSITVTKNHPFLVNNNGTICWKKAEELTCDDYFVCPKKLPQPDERNELLTHEETLDNIEQEFPQYTVVRKKDIQKIIHKESWTRSDLNTLRIALGYGKKELGVKVGVSKDRIIKYFAGKIKRAADIDKKLTSFLKENKEKVIVQDYIEAFTITPIKNFVSDKDVAFWLGCVLSDGTINKQNIAFYQKNFPLILGEFERITTDVFGVPYVKREYNNAIEIKIRSKPFVDYMHLRYGLGKIIPSWFLSFPQEMRRSFLHTFVGLETYVAEKFVFTQKNKHNINMISYMLRIEGIQHRIIDRSISRIKIYGKDFEKYIERIGFPKAVDVKGFPSKHRSIPLNKVIVEKVVESMQGITSKPWYQSYRSLRKGRNHMTTHFASLLLNDAKEVCPILNDGTVQLTEEVQYLQYMVGSDVCYEQITSIDFMPYNGLVYGLTVPGLQNYIAGYGACGIQHNTYPLPEAQTDRFLLKILLDYPDEDAEFTIVNQYTKGIGEDLRKILGKNSLLALQRFTRQVPIANDLTKGVIRLITLTRTEKEFIEFGASPRASIGLVLACKARSLMQGRAHVSAEDVRVMTYPILRHRIILNFEAERKGLTTDKVIEMMLKKAKI
jgi:MoxR-like ATPase/intein/homing endonuclease